MAFCRSGICLRLDCVPAHLFNEYALLLLKAICHLRLNGACDGGQSRRGLNDCPGVPAIRCDSWC